MPQRMMRYDIRAKKVWGNASFAVIIYVKSNVLDDFNHKLKIAVFSLESQEICS